MKSTTSIGLAVLGGIAIYIAIYFSQTNSDAFRFTENAIVGSTYFAKEVGAIEKIRVPIFGSYSQRWSGSNVRARMTLEVIGARKTVEVEVEVKKKDDIWTVERVVVDGMRVSLNNP